MKGTVKCSFSKGENKEPNFGTPGSGRGQQAMEKVTFIFCNQTFLDLYEVINNS